MLDQHFLPRAVAVEHRPHLRDRHVRLVDDQQEIVAEVVDERVGLVARPSAVEVARVVLDARAVAHFKHHLDVVPRAGGQTLGLQQLAGVLEFDDPHVQLALDGLRGPLDRVVGGDVVDGREDEDRVGPAEVLAAGGVDQPDRVDGVAEQLDAVAELLVGGVQLEGVAADAEGAALEVHVVAVVLDFHQPAKQLVALHRVALADGQDHLLVVLRLAQAEDATHAGDDHHVPPAGEARGGREAQAVEVVVSAGVLLDVDVPLGDVRLRLVVVVIADEVLDGVLGEELLELLVELGGEGLVVADDQRGLLHALDDVGHREGLAAAGDAQQDAVRLAGEDLAGQRVDGGRLIPGGGHLGDDFEVRHGGHYTIANCQLPIAD